MQQFQVWGSEIGGDGGGTTRPTSPSPDANAHRQHQSLRGNNNHYTTADMFLGKEPEVARKSVLELICCATGAGSTPRPGSPPLVIHCVCMRGPVLACAPVIRHLPTRVRAGPRRGHLPTNLRPRVQM